MEETLKKWIHPIGTPLGLALGTVATLCIALPVFILVNFAKAVRLVNDVSKSATGRRGSRR